ncbi:ABC-1 domain protein [Geobacter metallireducens RCH3]|uniref:Protein kinase, ABC1 domain-containing, putative n=1 Tax=Geobacter metallireducens (strain ATCC 53774 / DSM 7210 / GS-15) TaxID=269799 RepID=Q39VH1_GEOMG|nr:AarF/ABC1/UbiB kinase family protein [Geobacter metallireducens]ABB31753.1 protein kinase, ABC1 domain-containing, putative [Geobacter metallireducens GS-15]EHP89369.1 ABC-1 domain protein [Geobacter metallireducens RCH3]
MKPEKRHATESMTMEALLDLLPKDAATDPTGRRLAELVTRIATKRVPVSSFSRIWNLGSLQARVTIGYVAYWLRSRFADSDEKQRLRNEAHLAAALRLFGTMGYLRGAVMKIGQLLANLPEVVPEEFAEVLSALHFEAPPMHFSLVRELFLDEFGREPEELFASFDRQAFAAASLGQVHRARLKSGEEVAVKIQYPGIARTIKADLRNLRLLLQPLCLTNDWQNTLDKLADIEQMLLMETDYEQEARFCREARLLFTTEDRVVVPRVFDDYSTKRVLTTEFLTGCHLDQFLAGNPSQAERDHFTTLLTVATMRIYYRLHWFCADPHPGNFIFMLDGRLGLIDFGCTRAMNGEEWRLICELEQAHQEEDAEQFDRVIARATLYDSPEAMGKEQLAVVRRNVLWNMEPWLKEGLFDFGDREFFMRGIDGLMELTRKRYTRGSPLYLWSTRFVLGGRAVCYQMRGRCEFQEIFRQESAWVCPEPPI